MESALHGIYALVVFVSEISLVRCAHSFDFWYVNNSCANTVRPHFPWSILYICNNTKDYFSWEPEKINVKFHKNCENIAKILKISCSRCHFVKFGI